MPKEEIIEYLNGLTGGKWVFSDNTVTASFPSHGNEERRTCLDVCTVDHINFTFRRLDGLAEFTIRNPFAIESPLKAAYLEMVNTTLSKPTLTDDQERSLAYAIGR
jgi:hypothetical protein